MLLIGWWCLASNDSWKKILYAHWHDQILPNLVCCAIDFKWKMDGQDHCKYPQKAVDLAFGGHYMQVRFLATDVKESDDRGRWCPQVLRHAGCPAYIHPVWLDRRGQESPSHRYRVRTGTEVNNRPSLPWRKFVLTMEDGQVGVWPPYGDHSPMRLLSLLWRQPFSFWLLSL